MDKNLWLLLLIALASSCYRSPHADCPVTTRGGYDKRLHIINRSDGTLVVGFQTIYPDTTINSFSGAPYFDLPEFRIDPGENQAWLKRNCWETAFNANSSGIIQLFLFDLNVIRTTDWSSVKASKKYLKRYEFNLQQIKAQNWEIVYEP